MKFSISLVLLLFSIAPVSAQSVNDTRGGVGQPPQREQRRAELRSVLLEQRQAMAQPDQMRQFSEQERSALRQQLRQQHGVAPPRP